MEVWLAISALSVAILALFLAVAARVQMANFARNYTPDTATATRLEQHLDEYVDHVDKVRAWMKRYDMRALRADRREHEHAQESVATDAPRDARSVRDHLRRVEAASKVN